MKNLFLRRREEEYDGPSIKDPVTGEIIPLTSKSDESPVVTRGLSHFVGYDGSLEHSEDLHSLNEVDAAEIINNFYSASDNLSDKSRSIFKMEEFMATMPESLPMNVKLQTVINVLITSGFNPDELLEDGNSRNEFLLAKLKEIQDNNMHRIEQREMEIVKLEAQIDEHREFILNMKKETETVEKAVNAESHRITKLINDIISVSGKKEE